MMWDQYHPNPFISYYLLLRKVYGMRAIDAYRRAKQFMAPRDPEIWSLARIDSREVYGEDTFTDSDEWIQRRDAEWLENLR